MIIDQRWTGKHGIARYSTEVTSRISVPWEALQSKGKPTSITSFISRPSQLVDGASFYTPGYSVYAARRVNQLATVHDLIHLRTSWPERLKYIAYYEGILKPAIKRAGMVFTVSETSRNEIQDWLGADSVTVVNAGNGCSPAFSPSGERHSDAGDYVLYVGNLREHKNLETLLKALALGPDLRLVAVVPDVSEFNALAARHGVNKQATAMSGLDDGQLSTLYRGARYTVIPSTLEGFGLPALESICCETPVVYWNGCLSVAEIVGSRGVAISEAFDAAEWASALEKNEPSISAPLAASWDLVAEKVTQQLAAFK